MLNYLRLTHDDPIVRHLAELALFSALLTDGMRPAIGDVVKPGRFGVARCSSATLLVFGALISPRLFIELHAPDFLFAVLALILARPAAMLIALWRSELGWPERLTASWFGPKGFASVVYGLLLFQRHVPNAERLFRLIALVIVGSIVAHSSTDTLLARWFDKYPSAKSDEPAENSPNESRA